MPFSYRYPPFPLSWGSFLHLSLKYSLITELESSQMSPFYCGDTHYRFWHTLWFHWSFSIFSIWIYHRLSVFARNRGKWVVDTWDTFSQAIALSVFWMSSLEWACSGKPLVWLTFPQQHKVQSNIAYQLLVHCLWWAVLGTIIS